MKLSSTILLGIVMAFLTLNLASCKQETKDKMKEAGEAVAEEAEAAAEKVEEAASEASEEMEKAADKAGDALKEAAEDVREAVSDGIKQVRVAFDPGAASKTVESSLTGDETVDYLLNVQKGQLMNISMATQHGATYFNIMEPGEQYEAIYNGSISGNQFEGTTAKSGDYTVRVYMMRSAARRGETADYRLEMIVGN